MLDWGEYFVEAWNGKQLVLVMLLGSSICLKIMGFNPPRES